GDAGAERDGMAALAQRHLDTTERGEDLELAERAEVADAEHATPELAEAYTEREVESIARASDEEVRVEALRHDDRGEAVGVGGGLLAEEAEAPRKCRCAHTLRQAMVPREDLIQALGEEHVERLAQSEQHERRRRVGEEAGGVVLADRSPVEEVPRAAALRRHRDRARRGAHQPEPRGA